MAPKLWALPIESKTRIVSERFTHLVISLSLIPSSGLGVTTATTPPWCILPDSFSSS